MSKEKLRICLIGKKIQVQSRATDTGLFWQMASGIARRGHDVTIISTTSPLRKPEIMRDGLKAYYVYDGPQPSRSLDFADAAHKLFATLHAQKPFDLVHSLDDSGYRIGRNKKNYKVPVAYDIESIHLAALFSLFNEAENTVISQIHLGIRLAYRFLKNYFLYDRSLLLTADGMFTTTPQQRTLLERYYLYPEYHTYTVPYGINLGDLTERPESEDFKLKHQIPEDANIILAISDFSNANELKPLLSVFEKVVLKHNNTFLFLIGDGPGWKEVQFEMLKRVLSSRVFMPGDIDNQELLNYITHSKIYINLSSQSTGLEPSLIEAMAQKKIVIGSELSPIAEIISDHFDGFLVRPADEITISKLLTQIMQNYSSFSEIGENARQKVLNVFNRDKLTELSLEAYFQILKKRGFLKRRDNLKPAKNPDLDL